MFYLTSDWWDWFLINVSNASTLYSGMPSLLLSCRTSFAFWSVRKRSTSSRLYCVTVGPASASRKLSPARSLAEGPLPDLPSSAWDHLRCWPVATRPVALVSPLHPKTPATTWTGLHSPPPPSSLSAERIDEQNQGNECVSEQERARAKWVVPYAVDLVSELTPGWACEWTSDEARMGEENRRVWELNLCELSACSEHVRKQHEGPLWTWTAWLVVESVHPTSFAKVSLFLIELLCAH